MLEPRRKLIRFPKCLAPASFFPEGDTLPVQSSWRAALALAALFLSAIPTRDSAMAAGGFKEKARWSERAHSLRITNVATWTVRASPQQHSLASLFARVRGRLWLFFWGRAKDGESGRKSFWRMGWDSNPRDPCGPAGFQDRCLQPLGHPSLTRPLEEIKYLGRTA